MSNRLWIIGAIAAIIAVLGLGWLLGVAPKLAEAAVADAEYAAIEQQNIQQEQLLVELRELYNDLGDIEDDIDELRVEIPEAPDVDEFVDSIQAAATTAGVSLERVAASEPTIYGATANADVIPTDQPATTPTPAGPEGVYVVPVTIDVKGSAEAVIRFSELVQRGTRLFLAQSFGLTEDTQITSMVGFLFVVVDPQGADLETPTE